MHFLPIFLLERFVLANSRNSNRSPFDGLRSVFLLQLVVGIEWFFLLQNNSSLYPLHHHLHQSLSLL